MNPSKFKDCSNMDPVKNNPGIYCLRIKNINLLPNKYTKKLLERNHNIIYIGIAERSLKKRFLNQELRAKGHGTFFRSLGTILGYKPPQRLSI